MEQIKVRKKDTIIFNTIIFLILSFFFLYIQHAYRHHISPFSIIYLRKGVELFWYVAISGVLVSFMVWKTHKWSQVCFQLFIGMVSFKILEGLFIEFNKIIVLAMFFYLVISYFLYQLLSYYLSLASVNANYQSSDLFSPLLKEIHCKLLFEGGEANGTLSNWDEEGCFIRLQAPIKVPPKIRIVVDFRGRQFVQPGEVVASTADKRGCGIKFGHTLKELNVFNWSEFIEIIQELGFEPERLR